MKNSKAINIVYLNSNLDFKYKKMVEEVSYNIEKFIPEQSRKDFYRNLLTLQISFDEEGNERKNSDYIAKDNKIIFPMEDIQNLRNYTEKFKNPEDVFEYELKQTLTHEMMHMASSYYDEENEITYIGMHKAPYEFKEENSDMGSYVAITEGITEFFACKANNYKMTHGYPNEYEFARQLCEICGEDFIKECYFEHKSINVIKNKLYEVIPNTEKIDRLFGDIEMQFQFKKYGQEDYAKETLNKANLEMKEFLEVKKEKSKSRFIKNLFSKKDNESQK